MRIIDKIYNNIYWSVNKNRNGKSTTIWVLNYLLFPMLAGLIVLVLSVLLYFFAIKVEIKLLIGIGLVIAFFLSDKLIDKHFTEIKQNEIIKNYDKPGIYRYLILTFLILVALVIMILSFFITGIINHLY